MIIFRKAHLNDAEKIMYAIEAIASSMPDPSLCVMPDWQELLDYINEENGFTLLAMDGEQIAGYFVFLYPKPEEDYLGCYLSLNEDEQNQLVYMELAGVVPAYQGQGLQKKMLAEGERLLKETSRKIAMSTVSPNNPASLTSMLKGGFQIAATAPIYGDLIRHVLYKYL